MANRKSQHEIRDIHAERDVILGDQTTYGYTPAQVEILIEKIRTEFQPKPFDGTSPYVGLSTFEEPDAPRFFGRERSVTQLVERVKSNRALFIIGPSGSGKSSLVRAGLIPALKQGRIADNKRWLYTTMTPGRDPLESLAVAVSRLKSPETGDYLRERSKNDREILHKAIESSLSADRKQRAVLLIDQFEEVFTQVSKDEERQAFINLLTNASVREHGRLIVLFTMRSDFIADCATYPALNELLNQQRLFQVGLMQPDELVRAIAMPSEQVGLHVEPKLISQIIEDMGDEPGVLPLMQFALKDLFDYCQSRGGMIALTLADYRERGGIHEALERHADAAFEKLSTDEKKLAENIFKGLIEIGRGTQDTRRTARFSELVPVGAQVANVNATIRKLADERLITTDEYETVTISHEKLIDAWPWLKKLVNENRVVIELQNRIAEDAQEWEENVRDVAYLYTGARLATVREKIKEIGLNEQAKAFVEASRQAEEGARRRRERTRTWATVGLISIAVIMAGLAIWGGINAKNAREQTFIAQAERDHAEEQTSIARSRELAALARENFRSRLDLSLLLSIEAFKENDNQQTRDTLKDTLLESPHLRRFLNAPSVDLDATPDNFVGTIAINVDGQILAFSRSNNTIVLWDIVKDKPIGEPLLGHSNSVNSLAFSPDGTTLASGSWDNTIIFWNVRNGQPIERPLKLSSVYLTTLTFSSDGNILASGSCTFFRLRICIGSEIVLWDIPTGQPIGEPLAEFDGEVKNLVFGQDDLTLTSWSSMPNTRVGIRNTMILWDVNSHQQLSETGWFYDQRVSDDTPSSALNSSGRLVYEHSDNTIVLWDMADQILEKEFGQRYFGDPITGFGGDITSMALSPDGTTLAYASNDNKIFPLEITREFFWISFFVRARPFDLPLTGYDGEITSLVFGPNGHTLASASSNGQVILWDLTDTQYVISRQVRSLSWIFYACEIANRNFTRAEWDEYFPGAIYRKTCDKWPLAP